MSTGPESPDGSYEVPLRSPLVVLAVVDDTEQVKRLAEQLAADFADVRFIGIFTADDGDDIEARLVGLASQLAEVIFTASSAPGSISGAALAMRAHDEIGIGQDFVFTVPRLTDAIHYGIGVLTDDGGRGWDGTAMLVAGSGPAVQEARQAVRTIGDDGSA